MKKKKYTQTNINKKKTVNSRAHGSVHTMLVMCVWKWIFIGKNNINVNVL